MGQCCLQVDAGVRNVAPGEMTKTFLMERQTVMRFLGGLALGGLATAAYLFDSACRAHLGTSFEAMLLILITGYVTTALRQVCSIMAP